MKVDLCWIHFIIATLVTASSVKAKPISVDDSDATLTSTPEENLPIEGSNTENWVAANSDPGFTAESLGFLEDYINAKTVDEKISAFLQFSSVTDHKKSGKFSILDATYVLMFSDLKHSSEFLSTNGNIGTSDADNEVAPSARVGRLSWRHIKWLRWIWGRFNSHSIYGSSNQNWLG